MSNSEEYFEIYDEQGNRLGLAPRRECHGNLKLIHRTVHVVICHPATGELLLQLRSAAKDIQPGKWDTAVGGHVMPGESWEIAARREMSEELGLAPDLPLIHLFDSTIRNTVESENVRIFGALSAGPFNYQKEELDGVRFWSDADLTAPGNRSQFTPNLCRELDQLFQSEALRRLRENIDAGK